MERHIIPSCKNRDMACMHERHACQKYSLTLCLLFEMNRAGGGGGALCPNSREGIRGLGGGGGHRQEIIEIHR